MIPLIETGGPWRDIGFDVGRGAREQIQVAAASAWAELGGIDLADVIGNSGRVVIDVTARALWTCAGNPCRGDWREVRQ